MSSTRFNQPWVNTAIKKLSRKRHRLHKKAKKSGTRKGWEHFQQAQKAVQQECRKAFNSYVMDIVCPELESHRKRFWGYIKRNKCDSSGVSPLRGNNGLTFSEPQEKVEILNSQFTSAFSHDPGGPLPDMEGKRADTCGNITVTTPGIEKLLKNLKPHKASGSVFSKELRSPQLPIFRKY